MRTILILFSVFMLGLCSCSGPSTVSDADLIGKWKWVDTSGGVGNHINDMPTPDGESKILQLLEGQKFVMFDNETESASGTFELEMQKSIYSGKPGRFITCTDKGGGVFLSGIVRLDSNRLSISDNHADGVSSFYDKVEIGSN